MDFRPGQPATGSPPVVPAGNQAVGCTGQLSPLRSTKDLPILPATELAGCFGTSQGPFPASQVRPRLPVVGIPDQPYSPDDPPRSDWTRRAHRQKCQKLDPIILSGLLPRGAFDSEGVILHFFAS